MVYQGSKNRLSKELSPIIQSYIDRGYECYVEPFVGGANMIDKISCQEKHGYDTHKYLIALLKHMQEFGEHLNPKELSDNITREVYYDVKQNPNKYPDWYVGYVGFCCSYRAKWWGGYAKHNTGGGGRDGILSKTNNIIKQSKRLTDIMFDCQSFDELDLYNSVIYCDPPYKNTTKYKTNKFDYNKYYDWCIEMSKKYRNNVVLMSEYSMPEDRFECVWEHPLRVNLNHKDKTQNVKLEKLFIVRK